MTEKQEEAWRSWQRARMAPFKPRKKKDDDAIGLTGQIYLFCRRCNANDKRKWTLDHLHN